MARSVRGDPISRQNSEEIAKFIEGTASFGDVVFGFVDENDFSPDTFLERDDDGENYHNSSRNMDEDKGFWETQEQLLQTTIFRSNSLESKVRQATKEALREIELLGGAECVCLRPVAGGCRNCLRREVSVRIKNAGYNCSICRAKWRSSSEIPAGEHTYLEVVDKTSSKKGEVRIVIELNFRAEFEMAKASEEYNRMVSKLPELFVGKADRLKSVIKILCNAAKKCTQEKNMHLGPWRKYKYMQAKWLGKCERTIPAALPVSNEVRRPKPKASMLTFDLSENFAGGLHYTTNAAAATVKVM